MGNHSKICKAVKPDQVHCQAPALPDTDFCFFHDPSKAPERREAQARGGRQNRIKTLDATTPDAKIKDSGDVVSLLLETISQVRRGEIDPRIANSVGYLANILLKAVGHDELESRIQQLEALLKNGNSVVNLDLTETAE